MPFFPFLPCTILHVYMGVLGKTSEKKENVLRCSVAFLLKIFLCQKQNIALHCTPKEVMWEILTVFGSCKFKNQPPLRMLSFTWAFTVCLGEPRRGEVFEER